MGCKCPILFFSSARVPCVIKGLMKCSACIEIKKSVCQKRQCKEAIAMRELANWGLDGMRAQNLAGCTLVGPY